MKSNTRASNTCTIVFVNDSHSHTEVLHVRLPMATVRMLDELAAEQDRSRSGQARHLLLAGLRAAESTKESQ